MYPKRDIKSGKVWFSLCQFRDNILCASSMRPGQTTNVIQMISDTLSKILDLEVPVLVL